MSNRKIPAAVAVAGTLALVAATLVSANAGLVSGTGRWNWSIGACCLDSGDTGPHESIRQQQRQKPPAPAGMDLTTSGTGFKVDGQARFLVFISYFDALHESANNLASDFAYLENKGVDGIRILPNWWRYSGEYPGPDGFFYAQDTLIAPDGSLRSAPLTKLLKVLDLAKQWGLIVDLSFSAESVGYCPADNCHGGSGHADISSLNLAPLRNGLVALSTVLSAAGSAYKHVFFDLQNESDKRSNGPRDRRPLADYPLDVRSIVQAVHAVAPHIIVTASMSGDSSTTAAKRFADNAWLGAIAWHERRDSAWWNNTSRWVTELRAQGLPVYLQEPAPSDHSAWTPSGIKASLLSAYNSGAAAWCFHTRRSFHLSDKSLRLHLLPADADFLDALTGVLPDR